MQSNYLPKRRFVKTFAELHCQPPAPIHVSAILPDLFGSGLDALNAAQPAGKDPAAVERTHDDRLALQGAIYVRRVPG